MNAPIGLSKNLNSRPDLHVCGLLRLCLAVALGAGLCALTPAVASTVAAVTLPDLVARSEFIFEGKVRHIAAQREANSRHIWTRVTFDVVDVIKGKSRPDTVTLDFLGGTYGGKTLRVTDMRIPTVEEHGVYFVESQTRRQVHPLFGWAQGHFIIVSDSDGYERVTTTGAQPVLDLERTVGTGYQERLSTGVARGVVTRRAAALSKAMSLRDFKRRLAEMVAPP